MIDLRISSMMIRQQNSFRLHLIGLLGIMLAAPLGAAAQSGNVLQDPDSNTEGAYRPITNPERSYWFLHSTIGARSMGAGVVSASWGTLLNKPEEYGTHWGGFSKRYVTRLSGVSIGNAIEAGLGMAINEDPRYFRSVKSSPWQRARHAAAMTVLAYHSDGSVAPAYARYAGIVGNNFLSNTWRAPSESNVSSALTRTALGFGSRFISNLFDEFLTDLTAKVLRHK
jgi:hypothetical protein